MLYFSFFEGEEGGLLGERGKDNWGSGFLLKFLVHFICGVVNMCFNAVYVNVRKCIMSKHTSVNECYKEVL